MGVKNWPIYTGVQITIGRLATFDGTPQAGAHAARHHGFNRHLTVDAMFFSNTGNAGQHRHRTAGIDNIRGAAGNFDLYRICHQALITGTAVIGGGANRQPQFAEICAAKQIIFGSASDENFTLRSIGGFIK
jgi:hypothetical protein